VIRREAHERPEKLSVAVIKFQDLLKELEDDIDVILKLAIDHSDGEISREVCDLKKKLKTGYDIINGQDEVKNEN